MPSPFDDIFGSPGPAWTWDQMTQRADALADAYRIPRPLVRAVIQQESNWDPQATGDGGKAIGLFQLHAGAATAAGIHPNHRDDIGLNLLGGVRYLRQKLDQTGGHVDQALRLYNGGGDPNYVANVRRHLPEQTARVARAQAPGTPETAQPGAAVWDDIFGPPPPATAPATPPSPPTARSTPEEAAAYRQWARQQAQERTSATAPGSQMTPPPPPSPGGSQGPAGPEEPLTPEARFLRLSSIQQMPLEARIKVFKDFYGLRPELKEEFLRGEEPPSDVTIDIEKASPPAPAATAQQLPDQARARQARPPEESPALASMIEPIDPHGVQRALASRTPFAEGGTVVPERPEVQRVIDAATDMGYGAIGAMVGGAVGGVPGMLAGPVITQGLLDRARMHLGMRPQEKAVFELGPVNVYQSDLLNAGFSLLLGSPDIVKSVLSRSKAGQAIRAADDATRAAHDAWQQEVARLRKAHQEGQQALYEEGVIKARVKQRDYQMQVAERRKVIEAHQQAYDNAMTQYRQEVQAQQTARQAAETAQGRAIERLRATPERYRPTMPTELPPRPEPAPARAGQVVDPYYHADGSLKQPLNKTPPLELELQDLLRRPDAQGRWGIKLEGNQELTQELTDLLSRRESGAGARGSGRQTLINNANGVTPDEWAQRLEQLGYTRSADINTFKEALDDSVTYGQRVFSTSKTPAEFVETSTSPTRRASGGSVSSRLYDELSYHHAAPVDPSLVRDRVAELRDMVEPLTAVTPAAARIKAVVTTLEKLELTDVKTVHKLITDMRQLTTSPNGALRHTAWEALSILEEAVEQTGKMIPETAAAGTVMGMARKAYRQDQAIHTLNKAIQSGGPVISKDAQGREVLNVKAAVNLVDKLVVQDRYFGGAFSEPQLAALRKDIGGLAGTPAMPRGAGRTITPPTRQADPARPTVPGDVAVRQLPEPTLPGEPAPVTPREKLGARPPFGGAHAGTWGLILGSASAAGVPLKITAPAAAIIGARATLKQIRWLIANALLDPKRSGIVRAAMDPSGRLDRRLYGALAATLSPAEKRQYLRETR